MPTAMRTPSLCTVSESAERFHHSISAICDLQGVFSELVGVFCDVTGVFCDLGGVFYDFARAIADVPSVIRVVLVAAAPSHTRAFGAWPSVCRHGWK